MTIKPIPTSYYQEALQAIAQLTHSEGVVGVEAEKAAQVFFEQLFIAYGGVAVRSVLEKTSKGDSVLDGKISEVYLLVQAQIGDKKSPSPIQQLHPIMEPYCEADALIALWSALSKKPELKTAMAAIDLSKDPLECAQQIRIFLEGNKDVLQKIKDLDLSGKWLRRLPSEIQLFTNLQTLDISRNAIVDLPPQLFGLKNLKALRARSNCLLRIPPAITQLRSLENLQLQENQLEQLPDEIGSLTQLKMLNLANNRLRYLPDSICKCIGIVYLYLDNNQLNGLPQDIHRLESLYGLYLHNNKITVLPDGLFKLKGLGSLCLSNNPLGVLPELMGNLTGLQYLWCSNIGLKILPKSIGELARLTHLSIDGNQIEELPETLEWTQLYHFCFWNNPLQRIPGTLGTLPFWSTDPNLFPRVEMLANPQLNRQLTQQGFSDIYWRLGANKWKETVDGIYHQFGRLVFDQGLHDPSKTEVGYITSIEDAFNFLSDNFNRVLDADFYLETHRRACAHFNGAATATWVGQDMIGVFRDMDHPITADFAQGYALDAKMIKEFTELNNKLRLLFGSSFCLGDLIAIEENSAKLRIRYSRLTAEQVRIVFNYFVTEFYFEMGHAINQDQKLTAIARWFQHNEWLHPPVDGCGRTDLAMLNYLLSCYGFNPCILQLPYVSSCRTLEEWISTLKEGMNAWRQT